jgi:HAE1 family hydrophobic/amphiphilic exporter-1
MNLIKLSIDKPISMLMVLATLIVFGFYTFRLIAIDNMPDMNIPYITVQVVYPGAGPDEIETSIIEKLEEDLSLIEGVEETTAWALEGAAIIILKFSANISADLASIDVKDKVSSARQELPDDILEPTIQKFSMTDQPLLSLALSGPGNMQEIKTIAEDIIKPRLGQITGVASVNLIGGLEREILVELRKSDMEARFISHFDILQQIGAANLDFPLGQIQTKNLNVTLRLNSRFNSIADIARLEIPTHSGIIRLNDIADVKDSVKEVESLARFNGVASVGIDIKKAGDANVVAVAEKIKERLDDIRSELPPGYELGLAKDDSRFIRNSVDDVYNNIIMGIVLTAVILLVFLRNLPSTFIAALTMPLSIIATFTFMYASGFTINALTLMALGISVGILVTNAIVVLENIIKHLGNGDDPKVAAFKGTAEIATAVVASTLTNVAVFIPIAFMQSMVGQIFESFGLTIVYATFASLFMSFTLTPMLASLMLKPGKVKTEAELLENSKGFMNRMIRFYEYFLLKILTPWGGISFILITLGLLGSLVIIAPRLGSEFAPKTDEGIFTVKVEMPPGTRLTVTDQVSAQIEKRLKNITEVATVYSSIGISEGIGGGPQTAIITALMKPLSERTRSTEQVVAFVRTQIADIPDATLSASQSNSMGGDPNATDLDIQVSGSDMEGILWTVDTLQKLMLTQPGVVDVSSSWKTGKPERVYRTDRSALADYGISAGQIGQTLRHFFYGQQAGVYRENNKEYDITIKYAAADRQNSSDVLGSGILSPKGFVPLSALVSETLEEGPTTISRKNKQRMVSLGTNLSPGVTPGEVQKVLDASIAKLNIPGDTKIHYGGDSEMMADAVVDFSIAILMAILLTYILLAALLESFIQPVIIMATIPLGLIGVIWSLFITGKSISIIALMAVVMLIGIVVNNAILIMDYANLLVRKKHLDPKVAIIRSGKEKFRAIMMTNLATMLAMLPLALGFGEGAEFRQPMAITAVGGLITSTLLTIFLIPVLYWITERLRSKLKRQKA